MTLQEVRNTYETKTKQVLDARAEKKEISRLMAKIEILNNAGIENAMVNAAIRKDTTTKLEHLDNVCKEIVASMPIYSKTTKENRKWNPSRQYGISNQIALLTGILSGIQYSASEHREQMLAVTGLDSDIIESALEAFGSPSYYSKNYGIVIPEVPYDIEKINENLAMLENILDIQLDRVKITNSVMSSKFETARLAAERASTKALETMIAASGAFTMSY